MTLLQAGLSSDLGSPINVSAVEQNFISNESVQIGLILIAILVVIGLVFDLLKRWLRHRNRIPVALQKTILLVTVPKDVDEKEEQRLSREPKEVLAVAETLYSNLGGIKPEKYANIIQNAWHNFIYGRSDHIALEIVARNELVMFYVVMPHHLQRLVELQIHAQYPRAHLEPVEDYNIFTARSQTLGSNLGLIKSPIFPIRTYKKLDNDPLNALTNVLSKLGPDEGAAIQILIRPAKRSWTRRGQAVARKLQHGKKLNEAMESAGSAWSVFKGAAKTLQSGLAKETEAEKARKERSLMPPQFLTPMEQELIKALEEKSSKAAFDANVRLIASSTSLERARTIHTGMVNAFAQYRAQESGNGFRQKPLWLKDRFVRDFIFRNFSERHKFVLNAEELASIYHLPLPTTETPNILWLGARQAPAPVNAPHEGIMLGRNVYRGVETVIRMKREDRRRHVYCIGITGTGKSVLIQEMAKQDIRNGDGVCFIDPHGGAVEDILGSIPKERADDVIVFDPSDVDRPVGLNMLDAATPEEADFAIQEMIAIFYKLFPPEMIGPMFEHNMRNVMLTLNADREFPGTIADIPRMFTDKAYQKYKLTKVSDPVVRAFWEKEMAQTSDFHKSEMLGYLISKVGRFVENQMMRHIIGQPHSGFNFREVMDRRKILLVNLSKGKTGEVNSNLLGLIVVAKLQMAALGRADVPEAQRPDFYLYVDEFQNFITDSVATILSEARKYRLCLTLAHQYLGQLVQGSDTKIRDAVLGTVGTLVAFRIGVEDAEIFAKQFAPVFNEYDLINIERYNAYTKLLIDNSSSRAFNVKTSPPSPSDPVLAARIKELSRLRYGRPRPEVEAELMERTRLGAPVVQNPVPGERLG